MAAPRSVSPALAFITIGALYITQGLPMGLAFMALPAMLRSLGYSTEAIGMVGVVILPWALKFLWAPLVDRAQGGRLGRRQSWIVPAQIIVVLLYALIALSAAANASILIVIGLLLIANTVSATQDIATDGWAVELMRGPELAWANGLQVGGFALGMLIGGAATLAVFEEGGWLSAFGLPGLVTAASIVPVLMIPREAEQKVVAGPLARPGLLRTVRRPGAMLMLSVAALFHFAESMAGSMLGPFLIDSGLSLRDVGIVTGTGVTCTAVLGAGLGGALTHRFGAARTAIVSGTLAALSLLFWFLLAMEGSVSLGGAISVMLVGGITGGVAYVAFFTIFMQWASPDQAGTDFTVLQCTESWTNIVAAILAGQMAALIGFPGLFLAASFAGIAAMAWIAFALVRQTGTSAAKPI